jgi:hypothetical protein
MEMINLAMTLMRNGSEKVMAIIQILPLKRKIDKMRKKRSKSEIMKMKATENKFKLSTKRQKQNKKNRVLRCTSNKNETSDSEQH